MTPKPPDYEPIVADARAMLDGGEINQNDDWLARRLVRDHDKNPSDTTKAQAGWLRTLVERGGARFRSHVE